MLYKYLQAKLFFFFFFERMTAFYCVEKENPIFLPAYFAYFKTVGVFFMSMLVHYIVCEAKLFYSACL